MAESILLYASTADGLFILSKPGTSKEWLPPRHVLAGQAIAGSMAVPGPPIQVTAALAGDPPTYVTSMNGGRSWEDRAAPDDAPASYHPTPLQIPAMKSDMPPVLLEVRDGVLYGSLDGKADAATPVPGAPAEIMALTPDPVRRERLYAGTGAGTIYTSADRGKTWQQLEIASLPAIHHLAVLRIG